MPKRSCDGAGGIAVNCTASHRTVGRVCLVTHLQHSAAATNASRAASGNDMIRHALIGTRTIWTALLGCNMGRD